MDNVLEAMIADGDNNLLHPFYFSKHQNNPYALHIFLEKSAIRPDTAAWSIEQRHHYIRHSTITYHQGEWEMSNCYNTTNNLVEPFDPNTLTPEPVTIHLNHLVEHYNTLGDVVKKVQTIGYSLKRIALDQYRHGVGLSYATLSLNISGGYFAYSSASVATKLFGDLVPFQR
ncbi:MAG: hypothetical protein HOH77_02965 [Candidatus Latescibacteria bacterium]|nr:hypothetical protein [Candidatus Latescibacterota bacterium]